MERARGAILLSLAFLSLWSVKKDGQYNIPDIIGVGIKENHDILKGAITLFDVH